MHSYFYYSFREDTTAYNK